VKMLGYMLTWTTYGTWLQGDDRGYVKEGQTFEGNTGLRAANQQTLKNLVVRLTETQRHLVHVAIKQASNLHQQRLFALAVQSDHIHLVVENTQLAVGKMVAYYKNAARLALRQTGLAGRVWTKGYDKRFCFDPKSLKNRINYVLRHDPPP
jgi:REP element-mobilizing transposase RayT